MLIGLAMTLTAPAAAQAPPQARTVAAAPSIVALRIATHLASQTVVLAQVSKVLRQQLPVALSADPDVRTMEKHFPGVMAEMIAAMEPVILGSLTKRLPDYQRGVGAIFDRRMSTEELAATADFYESPTGEHLLALVRDGIDLSALLRQSVKADAAPVSGGDIRVAVVPAIQPAMSQLSDQEQLRIMSFNMTSAGRKMSGIDSELLDYAARFNNERDPETDERLREAVTAVIGRHAGGKLP